MSNINQPSQIFERTRKAVIGFYFKDKSASETELRKAISFMSSQTGLARKEQAVLFETLTQEGYINLMPPVPAL